MSHTGQANSHSRGLFAPRLMVNCAQYPTTARYGARSMGVVGQSDVKGTLFSLSRARIVFREQPGCRTGLSASHTHAVCQEHRQDCRSCFLSPLIARSFFIHASAQIWSNSTEAWRKIGLAIGACNVLDAQNSLQNIVQVNGGHSSGAVLHS